MHAVRVVGLVLCIVELVTSWDSDLTERLVGRENKEAAADAEAAGQEHWTELGVGVSADGTTYVQPIARGKRWRHIRAGLLLVANGHVQGGIFEKSVVLIVEHSENGTLGVVINKPALLPQKTAGVLENMFGSAPRNPHATAAGLLQGGPVDGQTALFLHGGTPDGSKRGCYAARGSGVKLVDSRGELRDADDDGDEDRVEAASPAGLRVAPGVHFMGSGSFLRCAMRDPDGPKMRVLLGHAGWGAQRTVVPRTRHGALFSL